MPLLVMLIGVVLLIKSMKNDDYLEGACEDDKTDEHDDNYDDDGDEDDNDNRSTSLPPKLPDVIIYSTLRNCPRDVDPNYLL